MKNVSNRIMAIIFIVVALVLVAIAALYGDPGDTVSGAMRTRTILGWMWHHELPWLIAIGIPSIINGLRSYKETEGIRAWLGTALEFLAVLARSDSPGTFKLPFTTSPPPPGVTPAGPPLTDRPPPVLLVLILAGLALSGCGPRGAAAGQALQRCELGALPPSLEGVIADVTAILFGGEQWQSELQALGAQVGAQQLNCVVEAVGAALKARARKGQAAPDYLQASWRADTWLQKKAAR